ncbi:MAG: hypothetical protein U5J63_13075 [Fodinibius sp.]|nr:hypothetical protein [Fodinibius sp.]
MSWPNATGDFTGNGTPDVIADQVSKENRFIDVAHRYEITRPIDITSIEDVPEDQGGWVRVNVEGYYMDALDKNIIGFDHYAVWRQDGDKWTNVATVPAFTGDAQYVDVHVPNTKATGSTADSTTYSFKVTAENENEKRRSWAPESNLVMLWIILRRGRCLVLMLKRGDSQVTLSWDASDTEDPQYEGQFQLIIWKGTCFLLSNGNKYHTFRR